MQEMTTTEHPAVTALRHYGQPKFDGHVAREAIPALEALIDERDELRQDASLLRCLITSSRFRNMAVDDAMTELRRNGLTPSAAIAKAKGTQG